jgi:outer membrane protein assembly factor BamD
MSIRLLVFIVFLGFTASSCQNSFNKVLKSTDYEYKLKKAIEYSDKKDYRKAQTLFEELFPIYKGTPQFEDLYYRYATGAYYQKDYASAENLFKGFLDMFPNSQKAEQMEFLEAYTFYLQSPKPQLDQTNTIKAIGMLQTFINTHPGSPRNKEAENIILKCLVKLETKEMEAAKLYYNMGQYKAAGIAYTTLINNYPYSDKADEYKLQIIKAYYKYANLSIQERRQERYVKVIAEVNDFQDRFPESKLLKEAERYLTLSTNNIKSIPK